MATRVLVVLRIPGQAGVGCLQRGRQEQACSWIIDPYGVRWQVLPQAFYDLTPPPAMLPKPSE